MFTKKNSDVLTGALLTLSLVSFIYLVSIPQSSLFGSMSLGIISASIFVVLASVFIQFNTHLERRRSIRKAIEDIDRQIRNPFEDLKAKSEGSPLVSLLERIGKKNLKLFKLNEAKMFDEMRLNLQSAGFYSVQAVYVSVAVRIVLPFLLAIIGYSGAVFVAGAGIEVGAVVALVSAVASFPLFKWFFAGRRDKRVNEFVKLSPEIFDMIAIYTGAGAFFDAALEAIADEIRDISPAVSAEMALFQRELGLLDRKTALENFQRRNPCRAASDMIAIIKQSENLGTSVTAPLSTLAGSLRRDRFLDAEKRGARIPILIILPMMLFIMPCIYIVVLTPVAFKFMAAF